MMLVQPHFEGSMLDRWCATEVPQRAAAKSQALPREAHRELEAEW